jgi:hypothetical protein
MTPLEHYLVGIVVELRAPVTKWGEIRPYPIEALCDLPECRPWTPLTTTPTGRTYYAGPLTLTFHADATERYRANLEGDSPAIWVALRAADADEGFALVAATVDSDEGESFTETPGTIVETVTMPPEIAAALAKYTTLHHRDRVFIKRKRRKWAEDRGA